MRRRASAQAQSAWRLPVTLAAAALLAFCAGLHALAAPVGSSGGASSLDILRHDGGFERPQRPRPFEFPRDHGPHPEYRHEWWYVTGNLDGSSGERFGFELTFFRLALAPGERASSGEPASRWRTNQLYMAHFAITDVQAGRFRFAQRYARQALGLAGATAEPLRVWLEDWSFSGTSGGWRLRARQADYDLELDLTPLLEPVPNGEGGLSLRASDGSAASYYYSVPRLQARGRIVRDGSSIEVQGLAWLDREWGSGALTDQHVGWDWFALQLADGSTLMIYLLRRRDGRRDVHDTGTWVDPDGQVRHLSGDDVQLEVRDHWTSPRGGRYPSRWRLRVPALDLDLDVRPVMADQELATSPRYWEGAVDVNGRRAGTAVTGRGYVELVGYAS